MRNKPTLAPAPPVPTCSGVAEPEADARLAAVIDAWPRLSEPMRDRLAALARAQSTPPAEIN